MQVDLSKGEISLTQRHRSSKTGKDNTTEMKNSLHPGALVADCLAELGFTVAEAAEGLLGSPGSNFTTSIAGRSNVTPEMAIRFEKAFGSAADTWLRLQMSYDLAEMRKKADKIAVAKFLPKAG